MNATLAELEYLNYREALEAGDSRAEIVAFFGSVRTSELEAQFAREFPEKMPPLLREIDALSKPWEVVR